MNKNDSLREVCRQEARSLLTQDIVILDTETTGLSASARIVELCIIDKAGNVLFNSLLNPGEPIPSGATHVHGISDSMVTDAPTFADIVIQVNELLFGKTVCIYNAGYDAPLLTNHGAIFGKPVCLMELYARYYGEWSDYHESFKWQALGAALAQCGLSRRGQAHRALSDCYAALDVLNYIAQEARGGS
jgi:DNA polymerase III subunit epsilon